MPYSDDDIAGVLDLFGALTRDELERALSELAARQGTDSSADDIATAVRDALANYSVVPVDSDPEVLVAGPTAFPTLPDSAEDLPHVLDVDRSAPDRERAAGAAASQLEDDVEAALEQGDQAELVRLLDVSYEIEAWGPIEVDSLRDRIDSELS